MPRFFTSAVQFDEAASVGSAVIDGEDGRHIARSLRMHTGDALTLSDGAGTDYTGEIESITGDTVMVRLTDKFKNRSEPALRVTLYPGMPKADKLELITQKAVELGVTKIVPVLTSRSVSRPDAKSVSKKQERLQRIALEAAKQSGRGIIPEIGKMTDLESALKTAPGKKILFYEGGGEALGALVNAAALADALDQENRHILFHQLQRAVEELAGLDALGAQPLHLFQDAHGEQVDLAPQLAVAQPHLSLIHI